jgi:CheY-like chemotaxis protein
MSNAEKIVVIDDTAEVLELVGILLTDEGYIVIPCQDARAALELVAEEQPALAIADLRMAGVERWELIDSLQADPRTAHVPVIVCSGAVTELRAAESRLRLRGGGILIKPFDIQELVALVHRLIVPRGDRRSASGADGCPQ